MSDALVADPPAPGGDSDADEALTAERQATEAAAAAESSSAHRADLDGLRGVAILLVVVGHLWLQRVTGGVDAFLMLGGVFVGTSLIRRVSAESLDLRAYGLKVARRFLPVVVPVVVAMIAVMFVAYPPMRWSNLSQQAIASLLMLENWWLAAEGTRYGGADPAASPFQHLWSLSVQAQLYLAFAALLFVAGMVLRRLRIPVTTGLMVVVLTATILSFAYAVLAVGRNPTWGYFDTAARGWELLVGTLTALAVSRWRRPSAALNVVMGWIGLVMLLSTAWLVDGSTGFPGPAALLPVGGAVLMVIAGRTPTRHGVDALLRRSPFRFTGRLAFGIYAWHWPLLVLYLHVSGRASVGVGAGIGIIIASFLLAFTSRRFIEAPFQRPNAPRRATAALALITMAAVAVPASWVVQAQLLTAGPPPVPAAVAGAPKTKDVDGAPPLPAVLAAAVDAPAVYRDGCIARGTDVVACEYGEADGDRTLALVGGSHSGQWFTPLEQVALERGFVLRTYLRDECYFGEPGMDLYLTDECDAWNRAVIERLVTDGVQVVFTMSTRSHAAGVVRSEWVPKGYMSTWQRLSEAGIAVVALRDTPWLGANPLDCLSAGDDGIACGTPRADVLLATDPTEDVALPPGVVPIDLNDEICADDLCPAVKDGVIVYRDDNHLTSSFASTLAPQLDLALGDATGWWQDPPDT